MPEGNLRHVGDIENIRSSSPTPKERKPMGIEDSTDSRFPSLSGNKRYVKFRKLENFLSVPRPLGEKGY